ncbi:MAG TPA: aldehyde dehydrogenase family protein [Acidimicrobiales bacterium]|nr:aldehyde dehydrogenase family protein [Acidimicrobiales bacterium]
MTTLDDARATLDFSGLVGELRATFTAGVTRPLAWRHQQLSQMEKMLVEHEDEFVAALAADVGKPPIEGWLTDLAFTRSEIKLLNRKLETWTADEKVRMPMTVQPATGRIVREPLGVALVIAPWNYPIQLLLIPMASAIAAGCAVVGKPSELAPACSAALARLAPQYLDPSAIALVEGGIPESESLLRERWDTIFYTGNGHVGRIVARAAAEHLTPVTLELGGKSPVIVDRDADLKVAANRIVWGKFLNAGQTCVAPDHLLVHEAVRDELTDRMVKAIGAMYGADPQRSPDYARIVNDRHFGRLTGLMATGAAVVSGGRTDSADRYIEPTLLADVAADAPVMAEEIFGPLLPIIGVRDVEEAIARVNQGDKPLALYAFSRDQKTLDHVVANTSSGGVALNHVVMHLLPPGLPFGGVGESGMGAYHGRADIDAFSHRKSVLSKPTRLDPPLTYPPFGKLKQWILRQAMTRL